MPSYLKCNTVMKWWLILLCLLATSTNSKSWESTFNNNEENGNDEDQAGPEDNYTLSRIADEGADNLNTDDEAFIKTVERKVNESIEKNNPLETKTLIPGDVNFPSDKVFFTTDHILSSNIIVPTDKTFPTVKELKNDTGSPTDKITTDNITTEKGLSIEEHMPTFPSLVNTSSTDKSLPADKELIAHKGFITNDSVSANESLAKIESLHHLDNVRAKKYGKMLPNNQSVASTTAKPADDSNIHKSYKHKKQQYAFWRNLKNPNVTRRMFGGMRAGPDAAQGRAVALLDDAGQVHCSGAALTRMWVLTVAHCLSKQVTLVMPAYDLRHVPIRNLYTHRYYKAEQRVADEGGLAVSSLQHDIGLAETTQEMNIPNLPHLNQILGDMQKHFVHELHKQEVSVYGFGRQDGGQGAELFSIRSTIVPCMSRDWVPCVCSTGNKGVCVGDSGGPVFYKDAQVAVTSLGPMSCAPSAAHSSVFTTLQTYVPLLRSTVPSIPEFRNGLSPPKPTQPNPDDYWIKLKIHGAAPCVSVQNYCFLLYPLLFMLCK